MAHQCSSPQAFVWRSSALICLLEPSSFAIYGASPVTNVCQFTSFVNWLISSSLFRRHRSTYECTPRASRTFRTSISLTASFQQSRFTQSSHYLRALHLRILYLHFPFASYLPSYTPHTGMLKPDCSNP